MNQYFAQSLKPSSSKGAQWKHSRPLSSMFKCQSMTKTHPSLSLNWSPGSLMVWIETTNKNESFQPYQRCQDVTSLQHFGQDLGRKTWTHKELFCGWCSSLGYLPARFHAYFSWDSRRNQLFSWRIKKDFWPTFHLALERANRWNFCIIPSSCLDAICTTRTNKQTQSLWALWNRKASWRF